MATPQAISQLTEMFYGWMEVKKQRMFLINYGASSLGMAAYYITDVDDAGFVNKPSVELSEIQQNWHARAALWAWVCDPSESCRDVTASRENAAPVYHNNEPVIVGGVVVE